MSIWSWLFGEAVDPAFTDDHVVRFAPMDINPATGLPMVGDYTGVDVCGNPYGMDLNQSGDHSLSVFDDGCGMGGAIGGDWPD